MVLLQVGQSPPDFSPVSPLPFPDRHRPFPLPYGLFGSRAALARLPENKILSCVRCSSASFAFGVCSRPRLLFVSLSLLGFLFASLFDLAC